jgi:hypothetical protein
MFIYWSIIISSISIAAADTTATTTTITTTTTTTTVCGDGAGWCVPFRGFRTECPAYQRPMLWFMALDTLEPQRDVR